MALPQFIPTTSLKGKTHPSEIRSQDAYSSNIIGTVFAPRSEDEYDIEVKRNHRRRTARAMERESAPFDCRVALQTVLCIRTLLECKVEK
ncbi:hypothetical protein CIPAW_06G101900 [Carya illinoinensis]|uniref:Uncharacterized protein n=1 Tax=Carya illinoinensis TaxID=32201 RepID=A0A8T1QA05_CARIL|nr:hypothetical protein CIPAW_06G101900 [Carya illinoinensis]